MIWIEAERRAVRLSAELRTNSPATMSSSNEPATCAMTSPLRNECRRPPSVEPRPPSRSIEFTSVRATRSAGMMPTTVPVSRTTLNANRKTLDIWIEIESNRQVGAQVERAEKSGGPPAEQHSCAAAEKREHQALGQMLANQACASCADRGANRHFTLANRRADQQNVCDVETRDEQNERPEGGKCQRIHSESCCRDRVRAARVFPGRLESRRLCQCRDADRRCGLR